MHEGVSAPTRRIRRPTSACAFALEAAVTFNTLGVDPACLLALGYVRQLEIREGAGGYALAHARLSLELAEKRRLLRSVGDGGVL